MMRPAGDRYISFVEVDEDMQDMMYMVIDSIFIFCIPYQDSKTVNNADDVAVYIISFSDKFSSSDCIITSSHSLDSEERDVDGSFIAIASTTLFMGRCYPTFDLLPPLVMEVDSSSRESSPVMELNKLPHTLKYAYLSDDNGLSVIICSVLLLEKEKRLIVVFGGQKTVNEWKVADKRGIDILLHASHVAFREM